MATSFVKVEKFDPEEGHTSVLEAFQEFISQFGYAYEAIVNLVL